ncbi:unnamed protein product [Psylliodes chrysocephalus]|uniref:RHD domain-containing protein n=1 Tax=Psylliodes chrysocephalus TaxID=3402493 RepID=A0A9P0D992_9CUCU|nr:unnamed protein product [Psylliodes chrysocephala]
MIVNQQNTEYFSMFEKSMSSYPLTPPSSLEDSPQSVLLVASPNSNTFEYETYEHSPMQIPHTFAVQPNIMIDPNSLIKTETRPSLRFIEQPTDRFRFRYKSEMAGTHGSLTGINSDKSRKPTYPTVELKNFSGRVIVRCSIYQSNADGKDFLPHAHRLIMKKGKEEHDDPHDIIIGPEDGYRAVFQGMGIIHTAKKNIVSELTRKKLQLRREFVARKEGELRELSTKEQVEIKGLAESESKSINLNIVCLRFDAFIKDNGILYPICDPIYSHGINNLKSALTGDLKIVRLDHVVSPAKGKKEVFILVERVTKKNIKIRFYELDDEDRVVWQDWGQFNDLDVHHQYAIVFKTPKYRDENITSPVRVFVELFRPSDGARSEPRDFRYIPNKPIFKAGQKRPRYDYGSSSYSSSNPGSEELPVPIDNLQLEQSPIFSEMSPLSVPSGLSEEIKRAMNNINSDEFRRIFDAHMDEYVSVCETTDAPKVAENMQLITRRKTEALLAQAEKSEGIKMEVTDQERRMAIKVVEELRSFYRTTHTPQLAIRILNHYFLEDKRTNALHIAICQRDNQSALLLLKIMVTYRQFELIKKSNNEQQTPLHLAVLCFNGPMVNSLLMCRARISALDSDLNTPLHLAINSNAPIEILEMLLIKRECENVKDFIDLENEQGNTALLLAIEKKKLAAIKLLCKEGADINKIHPKNGFVPLRFAIEKQHTDIVKFLLTLNSIDATIKDFQNVSPWAAAFSKDANEEITKAVQKFMADNSIPFEVKEEPEDDSEDEMEIDEEFEVKKELPHLTPDELETMYKKVDTLTPQCLDEVSDILDKSENWKCLAELLEIEHLIDSEIIKSDISMSKAVLTYSIETNRDSIWMIRNFLENLDEFKAVEIMDRMVQELQKC